MTVHKKAHRDSGFFARSFDRSKRASSLFRAAFKPGFSFKRDRAMKPLASFLSSRAGIVAVIGILLVCVGDLGRAAISNVPAPSATTMTTEIEALLRHVATLEGASFVRNGDSHTPKEAEEHLRLK